MSIRSFLVVLLSLSVSGSILAGLVGLCRRLAGPRISRTAGYYLWLLVLLRLLLPIGIPDSVMARAFAHSAELAAGPAAAEPDRAEQQASPPFLAGSTDGAASLQTPQAADADRAALSSGDPAHAARSTLAAALPTLLFAVWAAGAALVLVRNIAAYLRLRAVLRREAAPPDPDDLAVFRQMFGQLDGPCRVQLVCSAAARSPLLLGAFRPVLVLPDHAFCKNGRADSLRCLLRHEMTHYTRRDPWYKWLVVAARAVHWFNPLLLWLALRIEQDCELSCDEAVTARMTPAQRQCYGNTLLAFAAADPLTGRVPVPSLAGGGKEFLRLRLQCIRHPARRTLSTACLTAALCLLLTGCGAVLGTAVPVHRFGADAPVRDTGIAAAQPLPAQEPAASAGTTAAGDPAPEDLVYIRDYLPDVYVDLKYATADNLTGRPLYDFTEPMLRYATVQKLAAVQADLAAQGYSLMIWDAYRPLAAQQALWDVRPDPTFVSDPGTGYLGHSRGGTVDVTLVRSDGTPVAMPSRFDEFSPLADRDYSDVSAEAAAHARLLEQAMLRHGFRGYAAEWNHYSDETEYDLISA